MEGCNQRSGGANVDEGGVPNPGMMYVVLFFFLLVGCYAECLLGFLVIRLV